MRFHEIKEAVVDPKVAAEYTKYVDADKVVALLKAHCSEAFSQYVKTGKTLYKGFSGGKIGAVNYYAMDPSQIERVSQNTNNMYTYFTSKVSPLWKQMPPRNRSLICSSSVMYSGYYGRVFRVFPEDGTPIAVCPENDMWNSFQQTLGMESVSSIVIFLQNVLIKVLKSSGSIPSDSVSYQFDKGQLDNYYPAFFKMPMKKTVQAAFADHEMKPWQLDELGIDDLPNHMTVGDYLEEKLNPEKNGFKIYSTSDIGSIPSYGEGRECWFSGRCVLVHEDMLGNIITGMQK